MLDAMWWHRLRIQIVGLRPFNSARRDDRNLTVNSANVPFLETDTGCIRCWSVADAVPYLHIFVHTDGPEVVCQVVVRDVVVRHGEVTLDAPVPVPRVTDKRTFG
jgi:hypothetical protein